MHIKNKTDGLSDPNRAEEWGGEYGPYIMSRYERGRRAMSDLLHHVNLEPVSGNADAERVEAREQAVTIIVAALLALHSGAASLAHFVILRQTVAAGRRSLLGLLLGPLALLLLYIRLLGTRQATREPGGQWVFGSAATGRHEITEARV
jgi:hypothetical protein